MNLSGYPAIAEIVLEPERFPDWLLELNIRRTVSSVDHLDDLPERIQAPRGV